MYIVENFRNTEERNNKIIPPLVLSLRDKCLICPHFAPSPLPPLNCPKENSRDLGGTILH